MAAAAAQLLESTSRDLRDTNGSTQQRSEMSEFTDGWIGSGGGETKKHKATGKLFIGEQRLPFISRQRLFWNDKESTGFHWKVELIKQTTTFFGISSGN